MSNFLYPPGFRATDADDNPLAGGYIRFYSAQTTTPKAVYSDADLGTSLGTRVDLNSAGVPVSGSNTPVLIYFATGDYKAEMYNSSDVLLFTFDDIPGADAAAPTVTSATPETPVISKTSAYSVVVADQGKLINANPTGGSFAITLPSAVTAGDDFRIGVRHNGTANTVSVLSVLSQSIKSQKSTTSIPLVSQGETIWLVSDGADWIVDTYVPPVMKADLGVIIAQDRITAPPASPTAGARYIITGTPTGVWSSLGFAQHDIAEADGNGSWIRHTPGEGWFAFIVTGAVTTQFKTAAWSDYTNITAPATSALKVLSVADEKAQGTNGGTATSGSWIARVLNTERVNTITGASLSSNQITLPIGKFKVEASAAFFNSATSTLRFKSTTSSTVIYATSSLAANADAAGTTVVLTGYLDLSAPEIFELQYRVGATASNTGLGYPLNASGVAEVYSTVTIVDLTSQQGPQGTTGTQGADGLDAAYAYQFSTSVSGDPGTGKIALNNATPASVTQIQVSETDALGAHLASSIATWDDSTSAQKARIRIHKEGAAENFHEFLITGTGTDEGDYWTFPVSYVGTYGTISNGNDVAVGVFEKGDKGEAGTTVPDISGLTEDTANDDETDFLIEYDTSASGHRKVKGKNLGFTQSGTGALLRTIQSKLRDKITATDFAANTGLSDQATGLQAALTAATGRTLYIPDGTYLTSAALTIPLNTSVVLSRWAVVRATSAMDAIFLTGASDEHLNNIITGGYLDCNALADSGLWLKWFSMFRVEGVEVWNDLRSGLRLGLTAGTSSYEAFIEGVRVRRSLVTAPASTKGIEFEKCGDSHVSNTILMGQKYGIAGTINDSKFDRVHCWNAQENGAMTRAFDVLGGDNHFSQCQVDGDVSDACWYLDGVRNTVVQYGVNHVSWGTDNVASVFKIPTGGSAAIGPGSIKGYSGAVRWAEDVTLVGTATVTYFPGSTPTFTVLTRTPGVWLPAGNVLDFGNGDVKLTHSANALVLSGAANGYSFLDGACFFGGNAVPNVDGGTDLGHPSFQWKDIRQSGVFYRNAVAQPKAGRTDIESGTFAAAATKEFLNIPQTFAALHLSINAASCDTATRHLQVQVSEDNGSTWKTTAGSYIGYSVAGSTVAGYTEATLVQAADVAASNVQTVGITITGYNAQGHTTAVGRVSNGTTNYASQCTFAGSNAINAMRILWNGSGNFDAGTYSLVGLS